MTPYDRLRKERLENNRINAIRTVKMAEEFANAHGINILVFGTLSVGIFREDSDIDIALIGPPEKFDSISSRVRKIIETEGFECDIIDMNDATGTLKERIFRDGREPRSLG